MSWNIGENRNLFLRLKTKLGLYHVVLTTPKSSPTKSTLTIAELQQLPELEQCEDEISCLKWTIYNGRRKMCVGFQTDTDKVEIVVYRYRLITYLRDTEIELNLAKYKTLLAKRLYLLGCLNTFYKRCIVLDESTIHSWNFYVLFLVNVFRFYTGMKLGSTKNTVRKNLFLSACHCLEQKISLLEMDQEFPSWGSIGYGDSNLENIFRFSKVFRLHAILHDTAGCLYLHNGKGPGSFCLIGRGPNSCLLGHVTGLLYCLYLKLFRPSNFNLVDF